MERIFVGWERPLLGPAAEALVDRYASEGVLDLRGVVCVLPGGRGMRRLKERLLEAARGRGLRLVPPRTVTVGHLPELLYEPPAPFISPLVARRAWTVALRTLPPEPLEQVFGDLPDAEDVAGWDLLAGSVLTLHADVAGGGHRFSDVAAVCGTGSLLHDDESRWRVLAAVQDAYAAALEPLGVADRDLARIGAARGGSSAAGPDVWLIGVAELPRIATRLLDRYAGAKHAVIHAPGSEAGAFDRFGCVEPAVWATRPLTIDADAIQVVDRPGDQAGAVLRVLRSLGEVATSDVVIGAADDTISPYVEEWLGAAGVSVHDASGTPTTALGPVRLLRAVADFLEAREWESFAALIRHPDVERAVFGRSPAPIDWSDRYFGEHLTASLRGRDLPDGRAGAEIEPFLKALRDLLSPLESPRPLREWAPLLLGLLTRIYEERRFDPQRPADRRTIDALSKIRDALLPLHRLPESLDETCGAAVALRIVLREVESGAVPDEPEPEAVELLGWLELALDEAPNVIVTGVNEPALPQAVNADRFLPDRLRAQLGLLDNARRYARDAFHAEALVHSRERVEFIAGRITASGDPLRPSRLLLAQHGPALAERVRTLLGGGAASAPPEPAPLEALAGPESRFRLPPEPRLVFEPPTELAVTAFAAYLADPYRYVLERMARLRTVDDGARELDPLSFGGLAHEVLMRFGRSPAAASADEAEIARHLSELLDREVDRRFGRPGYPAVYLQVEHLRWRLNRFATWQASHVAAGWEVMLVEGVPRGADPTDAERSLKADFSVDGLNVELVGRIDRIDHNPLTGEWALIDYKTSDRPSTPEETHRKGRSGEWKDLQLPLYRHLTRKLTSVDGGPLIPSDAPVLLGYVRLCRDLDAECLAVADWGAADLEAADEAARAVVRALRTGFVEFAGVRGGGWADDPLLPLLGGRLLIAGAEREEEEAE